MKKLFTFALLCSLFATYAQSYEKGQLTLASGETLDGKIYIDQDKKEVRLKTFSKETNYAFDAVSQVTIKDEIYTPTTIDGASYVSTTIYEQDGLWVSALSQKRYYLVNAYKSTTLDFENDAARVRGKLNYLLNDCNDLRPTINNTSYWNEATLLEIIQKYTTCDRSDFKLSDDEVVSAKRHNTDAFYIYAGLNALSTSQTLNDFEVDGSISGGLHAGIAASPAFLGALQGRLFVDLEAQFAIAGEGDFNTPEDQILYNRTTWRFLIGTHFEVLKEVPFSPYLGIAAGVTAEGFEGSSNGNPFDIDGGEPIFMPRVGFKYTLPNQGTLALEIAYAFEHFYNLSFPTSSGFEQIDLDNDSFTLKLSYLFK